ncbi:hypothetical protein K435DRAFT_803332 [Dendrothele bispora CBS 962.96]|uniref:Uncharacterized protein n=1 Tax=Dendrothele bispora (strain CBS 962.96) TaxID=1314807 RepID=A0A4S8LHS4_DENBC|nr:hypothetical protein K435DRAFT_803332 [Dendrothele bispora CBS 962.96]
MTHFFLKSSQLQCFHTRRLEDSHVLSVKPMGKNVKSLMRLLRNVCTVAHLFHSHKLVSASSSMLPVTFFLIQKLMLNTEPCVCQWFLNQEGNQIKWAKSTCAGMVRIKYGVTATSSPTSVCTNVPKRCPKCNEKAPAVWSYNFIAHFKKRNPHIDAQLVVTDYNTKYLLMLFSEIPDRTKKNKEDIQQGNVSTVNRQLRLSTDTSADDRYPYRQVFEFQKSKPVSARFCGPDNRYLEYPTCRLPEKCRSCFKSQYIKLTSLPNICNHLQIPAGFHIFSKIQTGIRKYLYLQPSARRIVQDSESESEAEGRNIENGNSPQNDEIKSLSKFPVDNKCSIQSEPEPTIDNIQMYQLKEPTNEGEGLKIKPQHTPVDAQNAPVHKEQSIKLIMYHLAYAGLTWKVKNWVCSQTKLPYLEDYISGMVVTNQKVKDLLEECKSSGHHFHFMTPE